jgi:transcription elongation factor GreA
MIEEIRGKLLAEVEALNHELHVVLPDTLKKAIQNGDLRENADYRSRLYQLSDVDLSTVPTDRVGLGSRLTVVDLDTKEKQVFEVVIPDAVDVEAEHISVSSPLGQALLNKKVKDVVTVRLPAGQRRLRISKLQTAHDLAQ